MARLTGVFGGTFDPPHRGHLTLAEKAQPALDLDRVLWVVTAQPPHKPGEPITPVEHRVAMVEAAIRGHPGFELSWADIERPAPHYAVDTLRWLSDRDPAARWAYLVGEDSLHDLPTWHMPDRLLEACTILGVMRRPGVQVHWEALEAALPGLRGKVRFFEAPLVPISASEIRQLVRDGCPYRDFVPPAVADIIEGLHLYK
jgi:nicotinate-nucleotide adenylyltransferase